ncbi:NADH dehydrogenase [ubiquinone] 1 alpha subcomplex assembly factor 8 isoform X2 [Panthera leo]|uniref:NADH dehydrogenase [ubiquinone] 1 alpha subcomplex assembly factor 8 isoform X2 n=1 Tax=Panthera leo TaxID=9689 RepID=UPI001C6A4374|nr:NADH dehydrogenase [ubiquinone] 1 alpha subcomplex assembly factor 8 isoform X2 [Panthera leo]
MSGNGAVWGRVRGRLRAFPERLAACRAEASTAPGGRLTKDLCVQEFEALRNCFAAATATPFCRGWKEIYRPLSWVCQNRLPEAGLPRGQDEASLCDYWLEEFKCKMKIKRAKTTPRGGL